MTWGRAGSYPGSGYLVCSLSCWCRVSPPLTAVYLVKVTFPKPSDAGARNRAVQLFAELEEDGFVDPATRALFLEFVVYNADENHFVMSSVLLEFPRAGGIVPSTDFSIIRLRRYQGTDMNEWERKLLALELVTLIFFLLHFIGEIVQIWTWGPASYLSSFYNWGDITITLVRLLMFG